MVTIEKLLREGNKILTQREFNNPSLEAELILCNILKKDKIFLILHKNDDVDELTINKFFEHIRKRQSGYPIQYITNKQEFMGLEFYVQEGVLVPRPDTEVLVEKVISIANKYDGLKNIKILDIGAGSGAIAVSLAHYIKNSTVVALDISEIALDTININIEKHNLKNITAIKGDIFEELDKEIFKNEKFDIIVSNPPYIKSEVISSLPLEVAIYEPKLALDGGEDGLIYYRRIAELFKTLCNEKNSALCVEIGFDQGDEVKEILRKMNIFNNIEIDKDLSNKDRVVTGFL